MLDDVFPPRGLGLSEHANTPPSQTWGHPWELGSNWDWQPGKLLLGQWQGRAIGIEDDRHGVTIAGARSGKSTTSLIPNLLRYPGSVVVIDPKGELARACAARRAAMGQRVFVLDPFSETGIPTASYNPFSELGFGKSLHTAADAAQLADALIVSNPRDPHWTDSAKNLVRGLALHLLSSSLFVTLREVRRLLNGTPAELDRLFKAMANSRAFDGVVGNIGSAFLGKLQAGGRELQGILSTAQEQTAPLDDIVGITDSSDFGLSDLYKGDTTIFLVLPGMRMGTHYRWLRLMVQQALCAVERNAVPRGGLPVWFVLEEFPALGHMRSIETAAGLMAGFGVKLWAVLQDLTQLQTHYPKSWETFLGNAGFIQAFGNADVTTTEHLSKLLGMTQVMDRHDIRVSGSALSHGDTGRRENPRSVRLLDPYEITRCFSRESNRQLVIVPGRPPLYMHRLPRDA
ncbi:type IV secretory system conjugative DNA transfer family protein [Bradyrhizobium sp.]|uniref:type IV secretory system conjugative DNA transfer family protein n=1 Tax=Bradyrhizobium sp. TaxID=376 RepID=UPI0039E4A425